MLPLKKMQWYAVPIEGSDWDEADRCSESQKVDYSVGKKTGASPDPYRCSGKRAPTGCRVQVRRSGRRLGCCRKALRHAIVRWNFAALIQGSCSLRTRAGDEPLARRLHKMYSSNSNAPGINLDSASTFIERVITRRCSSH